MAETRRDRVTLAALLAVLQERDRVFIVHRMGARPRTEARSRSSALRGAWRYAGRTWSNASPWTWANGRRYGRTRPRPSSSLPSAERRRRREQDKN